MVAWCLWSMCHEQAYKCNNTQNFKRQRQKVLPNQIEHRIDKYFTTWYCLLPSLFLYSIMLVHIQYKTKTIFVMFFRPFSFFFSIFISHHLFDSNLKTYGFDLFRKNVRSCNHFAIWILFCFVQLVFETKTQDETSFRAAYDFFFHSLILRHCVISPWARVFLWGKIFWKRFNYLSRMYHLRLKISSQNEHMNLFS